jgi:hypothetical protein
MSENPKEEVSIELSPGSKIQDHESENPKKERSIELSPGSKVQDYHNITMMTTNHNTTTTRIFDRKHPDYQSSGNANIERVNGLKWKHKLRYNWYHTIMNLPTISTVVIASLVYVLINTLFTFVWLGIAQDGDPCNTGSTSFTNAFYFSLITLSTIGYGNQDLYFNGCVSPSIVIMLETLVGIFFDAAMLGMLIFKFSRGRPRSFSVCFSRHAIVRFIQGKPYLSFRVVEKRKHQLVEAHIRCYAIRNEKKGNVTTYFQQFNMRLQKPDDELGGMLLLMLPTEVVHRIDSWSPLLPPALTSTKTQQHNAISSYKFPEILQRAADADAGSRDQFSCEVCGETYITEKNYQTHIKYCKYDDMVSGHDQFTSCKICGEAFPSRENLENHVRFCVVDEESDDGGEDRPLLHRRVELKKTSLNTTTKSIHGSGTSHISLDVEKKKKNLGLFDMNALARFFQDSSLEIIAIVEGVDPITSVSLQSRHSYHARSGDIIFDRQFAPCTSVSPVDGHCVIDYERFHQTLPLNEAIPPCSH